MKLTKKIHKLRKLLLIIIASLILGIGFIFLLIANHLINI